MNEDGTPTVTESDAETAPSSSADRGETAQSMSEYVLSQFQGQNESEPTDEANEAAPEPPSDAAEASETDTADTDSSLVEELDPDHPDADAIRPESPPEEASATGAEAQPEDDEAEIPDEVSSEEMASQPPKTRKRIQRLLHQRSELREYQERYAPVTSFIEENRLGGEDVQMALGLTAALQKGDFKSFLEGVAPLVQAAQSYMGQALSPELETQVNQGYITRELAQQSQAAQAQAAWHRQQEMQAQQQIQQRQQQEQAEQARQVIAQSVTRWEGQIRQSDPDYAAKEPTIRRVAQALVSERGAPKDPQAALALAKDAYDEANRWFQQVRPPVPAPTAPQPVSGMASRAAAPEPKSMAEAIRAGLQRARSA